MISHMWISYRDSIRFMRAFAKEWNIPLQVILSDVFKFVQEASTQWDYIFADPPYDMKGARRLSGTHP